MRFVATKTTDQLDLQALHRVCERLVGQRTGIINQIHAFLLERGIAVRQGLRFLRAELPSILAIRTDGLSPCMLQIIERLADDWHQPDERIEGLSSEIAALADQDKGCERLMTVPGIGRSSQANGSCNRHWGCIRKRPRLQCLAWTGAETNLDRRPHHPRQYLKARQSLSARLVRAGRLGRVGQDRAKTLGAYGLKLWIEAAKKRLHHNLLAIALANKLARIAWAVLHEGRAFECVKTDATASQPA